MSSSEWMTVTEVARLANVSSDTVRQWQNLGKLAATVTDSGTRLFKRADVVAYLAARQVRQP